MSLSVVVLAAGAGTRMKSEKPKVLHEICGKEMLYLAIKAAKDISDDVHVVLYHQKDRVKSSMDKYFDDITYHTQDVENYPGTGGAMKCVDGLKNEKVLVLNGDMPLMQKDELLKFNDIDSDIVMSVITLPNPSGYGRVVIDDGEVQKIVEEKDADEATKAVNTVNAGVYCFSKDVVDSYIPNLSNDNAQKEYYLTDVIEMAKNDDKHIAPLDVLEENFKGVNSKLDLADAEVIMQNRIKADFMKAGVIMHLPSTIYIEEGVKIEGESILENGVTLKGDTTIINSHIKSHSVIEDSVVENSSVGPIARIRPASVLKDTHIGNFVEVKKSTLTGVKAGHLSYLGDSEIDEGSNIGAGTITCNYDGKNKYKTIIGKNVFIGSDSQLVAPVTLADDTMIAAGSTITKDVEKGSLAISRSNQKSIANFFYKFFGK